MANLVRWGSDGFSFLVTNFVPTGLSQLIIFRSSIAHVSTVSNPKPTLSLASPSTVKAGRSNFVLTITGNGFVRGAVVNWNGQPRSTTFASPTKLTADISFRDVGRVGTAQMSVSNPAPLT